MALLDGQVSGPIELTDAEYFDWDPADSPVSVHMHLDAVDGIVRDVIEGFKALPRRGLEVGGLLLGRVETGGRPSVWVERYQRIPCQHKFGPQFLLDDPDKAALEKAAAAILEGGELAVVGLYRSHTRDGFQLEPPDFELIRRYFSDASDLILLIKPESASAISARFYAHDSEGGARPAGNIFPFRGRVLGADSGATPEEEKPAEAKSEPAKEDAQRPRRLVPDFVPSPVAPSQQGESTPPAAPQEQFLFPPRNRLFEQEEEEPPSLGARLLKWLPLIAALLLAGGALWYFSQPASHEASTTAATVAPTEPARPLGLAVEPMGKAWHVSWNPNATALHDARNVQLFVREGDDQNRIDLAPRDLAIGTYDYKPTGNDVTFRLEGVDSSGHVSAESFRFVRSAATVAPPAVKAPVPSANVIHRTEPKAIHRAPPVVAAGVRPRITGTIPIDVRVHIDEHGRVTSATPTAKPHPGLDAYLAGSAVQAAKLWRFEPARENGKPVPGTQTIHFVFEK